MLKSIGALVLLASAMSAATAADDIHIWVRGFIPDSSLTAGVLRASDGGCIATDHRGWSESIDAPARVGSDFHLVLSDSLPVLRPGLQKVNSASPVHQVDCQSLQELAVVPAQLLADDVGTPAQNQAKTLVTVLAAIPDPQRAWSSSTISYGATFTYDRATQTLEYQASTGLFPAYEAYATLNDGPVVTVFRSGPLQRNESTESSKVQLRGSVSLSAKRPKAPTNLTIQ
jgi:hypothetical protein